ncbi:FAD-dependent oxidoreductase [Auraticoccus monumenti]|uniref:FAD dependent oxidoreductase n=1 Tax=Auraticoccus monumenti TaxID=675864 RepID=A0A1G6WEW5_9ACTN|nr:FAD-dependent oxidoreductase [Auraticoccus monumenti]SDD64371.1 FAD dependent oxidoreductase [Auraticoccus monumenti]
MTQVDVLVVGGGLGGVAAALGALRRGRRVLLTEEHAWLGGQLTSQGVPPDEHAWVEQFGVTAGYRALRDGIRDYYRRHYPLTEAARRDRWLNPGSGTVSRLCAEPRVAVAVLEQMLAPYRSTGQLTVWQPWVPTAAETSEDVVRSVTLRHTATGAERTVSADYVLDATELGDLLPLTGTDHVVGAESTDEHGEPSAPAVADPDNVQPITYCFAFDHVEGADHTIERPAGYDYWREYQPDFWGDRLLSFTAPNPRTRVPEVRTMVVNPAVPAPDADQSVSAGDSDLWTFRRIVARANFVPGSYDSDVVLANWPMLDYLDASVIGADDVAKHLAAARDLSLSYFYWLQTEAPRPDGGRGWPGLRMRGDVMGTDDGLAMAPYIRESRRIRALTTVTEGDISVDVRGHGRPATFQDSVGVGMYRIDLHPSTGGDNYIDVPCAPFEIPLGALVPRRTTNLVAAGKDIGTTHITNGAYRLHPVEWNVGEAAGELAALCLDTGRTPREVATTPELVRQLQDRLVAAGVEIHWPEVLGY